MIHVLLLLALVVLSLLATRAMRNYSIAKGIQDVPNHRSSHTIPTPRGGGVAIVAVASLACLALPLPTWLTASLIVGGVAVALVGWIDDQSHVSARIRLFVHLASAAIFCAVLMVMAEVPSIPVSSAIQLDWPPLLFVLGVLFVAWMVNLYNFMDGIDGIAAGQAITAGVWLALLENSGGSSMLSLLYLSIAAASSGFLFYNWAPAKIFMGDVGSGFLGFLFGALALVSHSIGRVSLAAWLIVMGFFVVDATWVLLRRASRRESLSQAHRDHAYQHAVQSGYSHAQVTLTVAILNLFWLGPLAWACVRHPQAWLVWVSVAYCPLIAGEIFFRAGAPTSPETLALRREFVARQIRQFVAFFRPVK